MHNIHSIHSMKVQKLSKWKCYLFGNTPGMNYGICYIPLEGTEPNWFVRWMMKVCFACTWIKEDIVGD